MVEQKLEIAWWLAKVAHENFLLCASHIGWSGRSPCNKGPCGLPVWCSCHPAACTVNAPQKESGEEEKQGKTGEDGDGTTTVVRKHVAAGGDGAHVKGSDYLAPRRLGWFDPAIVYDHLGEIYSALIFGSFIFCIFLYVKGHVAPSSTDSGSSGNVIVDFYWGMELYPRIGKSFDIKVFTNCRFGMMSWAVLAVTYCIKQYEAGGKISDSMLVSSALMLVYITKFFWWESGYWNTMDIAHDRAGFYICWGCLVWVPSVYTSPALYLVNHPVTLGSKLALGLLVAGLVSIYINYDCDRQRQLFRATDGKCIIWGKPPSKIEASYVTGKGETKSSLLLTSGWWGISRHFHYLWELLAAFFWTVPGLFDHVLPYFYVIFLTILLFDRANRDDKRCSLKYGKYWMSYCKKVPYKIIPWVY